MKALSQQARDHLAALRTMDAPPGEASARVWDAVTTRAAAGELGPELPAEPAVGTVAAGTSIKSIALGVVFGAGVAIAAVAALGRDEGEASGTVPVFVDLPEAIADAEPVEPAAVPAIEPVVVPTPTEVEVEAIEPEASVEPEIRTPTPRTRPTRPEAKPVGDGISEEVALLSEARSALGSGEAKRAIGVLARHKKRFPDGVLARERDVSWITALCVLGRVDEARTKADAFLRAHGGSPHAPKVRASCGGG